MAGGRLGRGVRPEAERLKQVRTEHGKDAVAVHQGNPTAHNPGLLTFGQPFFRGLGTRDLFSATSVDQLPQMLASYLVFGLASRVLGPASLRMPGKLAASALKRLGPDAVFELGLRSGPYGLRKLTKRLSLRRLKKHKHGVDLGPLERRLPDRLFTPRTKINLAPREYLDDLDRLRGRQQAWQLGELVLIGRRQLRSNNSWLHNSERLVKGKPRCTLLIHPDDAERNDLTDGQRVRVRAVRPAAV